MRPPEPHSGALALPFRRSEGGKGRLYKRYWDITLWKNVFWAGRTVGASASDTRLTAARVSASCSVCSFLGIRRTQDKGPRNGQQKGYGVSLVSSSSSVDDANPDTSANNQPASGSSLSRFSLALTSGIETTIWSW